MAARRVKAQFPAGEIDAVEVPVRESVERWTEITLEDGSVLKIKPVVLSVVRAENSYDQEGNPLYSVKINQVMTVSAPDNLRKDAKGPSKEAH